MSKVDSRTKPESTADSTSGIFEKLGIKDRSVEDNWPNKDEEFFYTFGFGASGKAVSTSYVMREEKLVPVHALEDKSFTPK